jgi:phosphoglycolate phosphatase/putative hydrolase of the HAD superfamily
MHSKPDPEPFDAVQANMKLDYREIVMIGDRYEVDLEYPLSRGAGAILAESMQDLYDLPQILENSA